MRSADPGAAADARRLDCITVDAYGTLLELRDPVPALRRELAARGVERTDAEVAAAFRSEVDYYRPRSLEGFDADSLHDLRVRSVAVFVDALQAPLEPASFVDPFGQALVFAPIPGTVEALDRLASAGLALALVANWDSDLERILTSLDLVGRFAQVTASAIVGVEKPDPAIFLHTLARVGVEAERALHIGDNPVDEEGARRAGLAFLPPPLATLPERLGLPS